MKGERGQRKEKQAETEKQKTRLSINFSCFEWTRFLRPLALTLNALFRDRVRGCEFHGLSRGTQTLGIMEFWTTHCPDGG